MSALRQRSLKLTNYLETLLDGIDGRNPGKFTLISPRAPERRGAQLSIRLTPGLLEPVLEHLENEGVVIDERKPDVIRVAPAPLYNTFIDIWNFCQVFEASLTSQS